MEMEKFFNLACQPDFGDIMSFQIHSEDKTPGTTFSREGVENVTDQMFRFIMARMLARMNQDLPAKDLHIQMRLTWDRFERDLLDEIGPPWYDFSDKKTGLSQIDATHRCQFRA